MLAVQQLELRDRIHVGHFLMFIPDVVGMLSQHRHPVHYPAIYQYLNGQQGKYHDHFFPVEEVPFRETPVESDIGSIEPVEDYCDHRYKCAPLDKTHVLLLHSIEKHNWSKSEQQELYEEP